MAKAALLALITNEEQETSTIHLPIGRDATFTIENCTFENNTVRCETIKDAGDDPDATHKALIIGTVSWADTPGIHLDGGIGVGRVTKPGLPVPVGEAAINPVPRKMIHSTVQGVLDDFQIKRGVNVIISVPDGEKNCEKDLKWSSGDHRWYFHFRHKGNRRAFFEFRLYGKYSASNSVAKAAGCEHLVITTGGRSEKYGMVQYPNLPEEAFIEMGDFVGFTLKHCKRLGIKRVSLVGMMGKFSKVAQGVMMVHSKSAPIDFNFFSTTGYRYWCR